MQNTDFIKDFTEEALSHIDSAEVGLLKIESGDGDADIIHGIFRNLHSIKGTAGFFNLKNIVNLSHAMENLLGEIRNGNMLIDIGIIDILLSANDCLKRMVKDVENSDLVDISGHTARIVSVMNGQTPGDCRGKDPAPATVPPGGNRPGITAEKKPDAFREAVRRGHGLYSIDILPDDSLSQLLGTIRSIGQVVEPGGGPGNHLIHDKTVLFTTVLEKNLVSLALNIPQERITPLTGETLPENPCLSMEESALDSFNNPPLHPGVSSAPEDIDDGIKKRQGISAEDTIRVHISLLNDLLNLASEMVLGRNQLLRIMESHRKQISGLNPVLQNIDSITTELQEKIMQTRMQPIAKVFNKFPRIVRELSKKMGKDIRLQLEGSSVELDKSIIEALVDPLTHLVRNAVDHGIESPNAREMAGKPRSGKIILKAYHEGGRVNIDIIDDGMGIDVDQVKEKALQKGIISPSEVLPMGERELLGLLFRPGFSTAEKVTDVSGRGVGMDVVKTNIEKLGGTMEIMSSPGQGTIIKLILPLTLAIISSLIVEAKGQKFALPMVNLKGMVRVKPGDPSRQIERLKDSEVLSLRGRLLPLIHLDSVLGMKHTREITGNVTRILTVKSGSKQFGLIVDTIYDGEEILVKPLPRYLSDCQCYAGVTIMGDGRIAMILDPEGIISKAGLRFTDDVDPGARETAFPEGNTAELQNLLLFKCTGPETFGLDLSMVSRVEKIDSGQIEKVGNIEFIQFKGEALRLIRPESYLPIGRGESVSRKLYVIVPKTKRPMGILIEKIHSTIDSEVRFSHNDITAQGIVGSAMVDNQLVIFINVYELFEMASPKDLPEVEKNKNSRGKTVLLVEDTPFFAKVEKEYIESAGYRVITAVNGKEAWQVLHEKSVDAVVSDIEMPVMDGYELIKRIRADSRLSSLPVIAVTSKADERSMMRGVDAGFDFYEIKLDKDRLIEKIRLAFQKRRGSA